MYIYIYICIYYRGSSFYDLEIPQSELDFFSSDFEEELDLPYPGPKSNRLNRLKRYLIKCRNADLDDVEMVRSVNCFLLNKNRLIKINRKLYKLIFEFTLDKNK